MSQINYLEKENQIQPKVSRCQETVNIRAEIDEVKKGKKQDRKSMKPKAGSFKRSIKLINV